MLSIAIATRMIVTITVPIIIIIIVIIIIIISEKPVRLTYFLQISQRIKPILF